MYVILKRRSTFERVLVGLTCLCALLVANVEGGGVEKKGPLAFLLSTLCKMICCCVRQMMYSALDRIKRSHRCGCREGFGLEIVPWGCKTMSNGSEIQDS